TLDTPSYVINIEDNGEGMSPQQLELLNHRFNERFPQHMTELEHEVHSQHGIGLENVHLRIRLHYGAPYGIQLFESVSGGIRVQILLPKRIYKEVVSIENSNCG